MDQVDEDAVSSSDAQAELSRSREVKQNRPAPWIGRAANSDVVRSEYDALNGARIYQRTEELSRKTKRCIERNRAIIV
jgi:hypothetical protein